MVNLSNRNLLVLFGPILDTKVVYFKEIIIREIQGMEQHCFAQLYVHTKPILEAGNQAIQVLLTVQTGCLLGPGQLTQSSFMSSEVEPGSWRMSLVMARRSRVPWEG